MNFFENQDRARANTQRLVGLFALSVLGMIGLIYIATIAVLNFSGLGVWSENCLQSSQNQPGAVLPVSSVPVSSAPVSSVPVSPIAASTLTSSTETAPTVTLVSRRSRSSRSRSSRSSSGGSSSGRRGVSFFGNGSSNTSGSRGTSDNRDASGDRSTSGNRDASVNRDSIPPMPRSSSGNNRSTRPGCRTAQLRWWHPQVFFWVFTSTVLLVGAGSWYKIVTLQAGGSVVAQELGGRLLSDEIASPQERQLLNVVEEMAIAANIKVPGVYLLDNEWGINAFAAGHTIDSAVIGVTRGSLDQLTRDELQGVIGHEFSHILNGDMRLNLRLMGLLHGILFVYIAGRILMRSGCPFVGVTEDRDNRWIWCLGLAVTTIGLVGLLFGRLLQSAISRQREYLADASAVQFTRNPNGIAGALGKIGSIGSQIRSPHATETSHLFFGNALSLSWLDDLWATHPPLLKRIQRIVGSQGSVAIAGIGQFAGSGHAASPNAIGFAAGQTGIAPRSSADPSGRSKDLQTVLQPVLQQPEGATAIVYALLLNPQFRDRQLQYLRQSESAAMVEKTIELSSQIEQIKTKDRLPLLDLTVPALKQTNPQKLFAGVQEFARIEGQWSMFKFVMLVILQHRLAAKPQPEQFANVNEVWADCERIISALAIAGQKTPDAIAYAFRSGMFRLPGSGSQELPSTPPASNLNELRKSLNRLRAASPKLRQTIVDACSYTVLLDHSVTEAEAELLRAVAIVLDCPLPPFLSQSPKLLQRQ